VDGYIVVRDNKVSPLLRFRVGGDFPLPRPKFRQIPIQSFEAALVAACPIAPFFGSAPE
jgi:hypothetical protein